MLDLKELERRLDDALAKETSESLTNWIIGQRKDNLKSFFGSGCVENLTERPYTYYQNTPNKVEYKTKRTNRPSSKLAKAA